LAENVAEFGTQQASGFATQLISWMSSNVNEKLRGSTLMQEAQALLAEINMFGREMPSVMSRVFVLNGKPLVKFDGVYKPAMKFLDRSFPAKLLECVSFETALVGFSAKYFSGSMVEYFKGRDRLITQIGTEEGDSIF